MPKQTNSAARRQAIERAHEGVLADAVVNHRHAFAAGQLAHFGDPVLFFVEDGVSAAGGLGGRGFVFGTRGADDSGADVLRPLAKDQPDTAGGGMKQDGLAGLQDVERADQVPHRQAAQHHARDLARP